MKTVRAKLWVAVGLVGVVCLAWLGVAAGLLYTVLAPEDWQTVTGALGGRAGLLLFLWAGALVPVHAAARGLLERYVAAPARLADEARLRLETGDSRPIEPVGSRETRELTRIVNRAIEQRDTLLRQMDERIQEAARQTEQEKARLAALMSELTKSVVVCNLDGRILLYNQRAKLQFKRLSQQAKVTGGGELMGLGRSIYTVIDRQLIAHALDNVRRRLRRGADSPSAQFVTVTESGRLYRVQMTPVRRGNGDAPVDSEPMSGFVLLIENITDELAADEKKSRLLNELIEASRSSLANTRAAMEILDDSDVDAELRERLMQVIRDEVQRLSERLVQLQGQSTSALQSRWPLEDMLASDLLDLAGQRIESSLPVVVERHCPNHPIWLKVDSYSLTQGLLHLAGRLHQTLGSDRLSLVVEERDGRAQLDLCWPSGTPEAVRASAGWMDEAMQVDGLTLPGSVGQVLERHQGSGWLDAQANGAAPGEQACFRLRLPLSLPAEEAGNAVSFEHHETRPEFYDFDLFARDSHDRCLEDQPLSELIFSVFDTETTGLDPVGGDRIIQIGAVRIVNGRVLERECFDQLVDPERSIPRLGQAIHGISPDMVRGQPTIREVLPAFHAWCADTVLVAHNAAFDMKCLSVQSAGTGIEFRQPVLDTLLLSAVAQENQERHNLDDLAERFGLTNLGRHTAIGDAMVTAEILVKLLPLLADKGITTLGQALEASKKTYYARIDYG
ncbi:MAG: exonuclease domain-containing protein [Wenzhouxiangella sp.]